MARTPHFMPEKSGPPESRHDAAQRREDDEARRPSPSPPPREPLARPRDAPGGQKTTDGPT